MQDQRIVQYVAIDGSLPQHGGICRPVFMFEGEGYAALTSYNDRGTPYPWRNGKSGLLDFHNRGLATLLPTPVRDTVGAVAVCISNEVEYTLRTYGLRVWPDEVDGEEQRLRDTTRCCLMRPHEARVTMMRFYTILATILDEHPHQQWHPHWFEQLLAFNQARISLDLWVRYGAAVLFEAELEDDPHAKLERACTELQAHAAAPLVPFPMYLELCKRMLAHLEKKHKKK